MQPVLDPAATHAADVDTEEFVPDFGDPDLPADPEPPEAQGDDQVRDDYAPNTFSVELVFESDPAVLTDAQAAWRKANELIESARSKGLILSAGQVYRSDPEGAIEQAAADRVENALAELARLDAQAPPE